MSKIFLNGHPSVSFKKIKQNFFRISFKWSILKLAPNEKGSWYSQKVHFWRQKHFTLWNYMPGYIRAQGDCDYNFFFF